MLFEFDEFTTKDEDSIDVIYNYTESSIKAQEESLNRINARSSNFIGFAGVIIRLAMDLPPTENTTKIIVSILAVATILLGAIGLTAKGTGSVMLPSVLLEDKYLNADKFTHQIPIIKDCTNLIKEYEALMKKKQIRTNLMIACFCCCTTLYGLGVSGYGDIVLHWFYSKASSANTMNRNF